MEHSPNAPTGTTVYPILNHRYRGINFMGLILQGNFEFANNDTFVGIKKKKNQEKILKDNKTNNRK